MKAYVLPFVVLMAVGVVPAFASQESNQSQTDIFKTQVDELLKSEQYSQIKETQRWVKNDEYIPSSDVDMDYTWLENLLETLMQFSVALGRFGKVVLLSLLLVFVIWLVLKYKDRLGSLLGKSRPKRTKISLKELIIEGEVFDGVPSQDELYAVAKTLFDKGQFVACVSLLYQGTLRLHNVAYDLPINKSQTESQCQALLAKTKQASNDEKRFFDGLIRLWQTLAYGKVAVAEYQDGVFELLSQFNRLYPANFVNEVEQGEH